MKTNSFLLALPAIVGLAAASTISQAQDLPQPPRHVVALQTGVTQLTVHDRNASPLAYRGRLAQVGLSYQFRTERSEWFLGASAATGSFYAKDYPERFVYFGETAASLRDNLVAGQLQLHYLRRLSMFAGGEVLLGTGLQQSLYYPESEPHAGMISTTTLPLIAKLRYALSGKTTLEAQAQYAVAGLVTRLPWDNSLSRPEETSQFKAFYRNNTQLEGGHRLQQASVRLAINRQLGKRWQAGIGYDFGLLRHPDPQPLTRMSHGLNANLHFSL
jgi:energy-converting hydrogenase Eha subunit F